MLVSSSIEPLLADSRLTDNGAESGFAKIYFVQRDGRIVIELDDTLGYGSSFLEEAFGGLVRTGVISAQELVSRLELLTYDASLKLEIINYINRAARSARPPTDSMTTKRG